MVERGEGGEQYLLPEQRLRMLADIRIRGAHREGLVVPYVNSDPKPVEESRIEYREQLELRPDPESDTSAPLYQANKPE